MAPVRSKLITGRRAPLQIALIYFFFGIVWILISDNLLLMLANSPSATSYAQLQTIKGSVYVLITALLAWTLVRRFALQQHEIQNELRNREKILEQNLRERDALIQEIHHRVKNNLQIVLSIMQISSQGMVDATTSEQLQKISHRVRAIALAHDTILASNDLSALRCDEYFPALIRGGTDGGTDGGGSRLTIKTDVTDCAIPLNLAVPCGIVVNELVANAIEHAFPGTHNGSLDVSIRRKRVNDDSVLEVLEIVVRDNGVGYAGEESNEPGANPDANGLLIAHAMAQQVSGTLQIRPGQIRPGQNGSAGTEARLTVPLPAESPAPLRPVPQSR